MLKQQTRVWTVRELMKIAIAHLQKNGIEEARLNVELLLSHALQCQRIQLYTSFDKPLSKEELAAFRALYERRLNREPVQYIIGSASFMGLQFSVDPRVLIPRPETETLVEQTMMLCNNRESSRPVNILEVGTGSGNIAVSLVKFIKNCHVTTIDISDAALEVAQMNTKRFGVTEQITFRQMDVYEPIDQLLLRRFDVLVANPPYVSRDEWEALQAEVREYEPREATSDGNDGLDYFRRLIEVAPYCLSNGGTLLMEVGYGQANDVLSLMRAAEFFDCAVEEDLQSVPRVVLGSCHSLTRNAGPVN